MITSMKKLLGWRVLIGFLVVLVALPLIVRNSEWHTLNAVARSSTTGAHVQLSEGLVHYEMAGTASAPPVLLVWGEQDHTTPYAQSDLVRQALGEHQFLSVADAGHLPHLERPEVVGPALLAFLASP